MKCTYNWALQTWLSDKREMSSSIMKVHIIQSEGTKVLVMSRIKSTWQQCQFKKTSNLLWSTYLRGCGIMCVDLGTPNIICPSCKKYVWHEACLKSWLELKGVTVTSFSATDWSCPQCCWTLGLCSHWLILNYYS